MISSLRARAGAATKDERFVLTTLFCAYVFSILYFPFEIFGTPIISRVLPALCIGLVIYAISSEIRISHLKKSALLAAVVLSMVPGSIGEASSSLYLLQFASYPVVFVAMSVAIDKFGQPFIERYCELVCWFSVVASLLGCAEYLFNSSVTQIFLIRGSSYFLYEGQVCSLYSNPNIFGIATALAAQLCFAARQSIPKTALIIAALAPGVVVSGSRMGEAIFIAVLISNVFLALKIRSSITVFISLFLLVIFSCFYEFTEILVNLNTRQAIWGAAREMIEERPFFGIGLGDFQQHIMAYSRIDWIQGPNNMFWGLLAEGGAITLSLWCWFLLTPTRLRKKLCMQHSEFDSAMGLLLALVIASQFSEYYMIYATHHVYLILFAIISISYNRNNHEKSIIG